MLLINNHDFHLHSSLRYVLNNKTIQNKRTSILFFLIWYSQLWLNPIKVLFACLDSDIDLCSIDLEFFRKIQIFNTFHLNYWILNIITIHINSMGWPQMVYVKLSKRTNCFTQMIWHRNHWLTYNNCSKRLPGLFRMKTNIFQQTGCVWFPWHVIKYCNSL